MTSPVYSSIGQHRKGVILDSPSRTITSRVPAEFSSVIDEVSARLGMSKSEFIRRGIRSIYEVVLMLDTASIDSVGSVQAEVSSAESVESL